MVRPSRRTALCIEAAPKRPAYFAFRLLVRACHNPGRPRVCGARCPIPEPPNRHFWRAIAEAEPLRSAAEGSANCDRSAGPREPSAVEPGAGEGRDLGVRMTAAITMTT